MSALLLALEVVCVALVVAGVAMWSVPAALIIGGVLGVLVVERVQAERKREGARR